MDLQALRIEVATLLGWKPSIYSNWPSQLVPPSGDGSKVQTCPDYPNDPAATARDVLPEMTRRWPLDMHSEHSDGQWMVIVYREFGSLEAALHVTEPTFALAVCRAYLAACAASAATTHP